MTSFHAVPGKAGTNFSSRLACGFAAFVLSLCVQTSASDAHAVFERQTAAPNQHQHMSVVIEHGCDGSATTQISVGVPDGIFITKTGGNTPFQIQERKGRFAQPWTGPQGKAEEGTKEIIWSNAQLDGNTRGSFGFDIYTSSDLTAGQLLAFPVIQTCQQGERRWIQEAATQEERDKLQSPAPLLKLVKPEQAMLDIVNARSRVTPNGAPVAGGYLTIRNWGDRPDRLVAATFAIADHVEIHEMKMTDGVMRMRELANGLDIPAGATVELKAGSYHLMFVKPARALVAGEWIAGTLTFEHAGVMEVRFKVEAMNPAAGGSPHGHGDGAHAH